MIADTGSPPRAEASEQGRPVAAQHGTPSLSANGFVCSRRVGAGDARYFAWQLFVCKVNGVVVFVNLRFVRGADDGPGTERVLLWASRASERSRHRKHVALN